MSDYHRMTDKTEDTHCFNIFDFASFVFVCNAIILYICWCEGPTHKAGKDLRTLHENAFELIKSDISTYIVIWLKPFAKQENDRLKKTRLRAKLSKLIIFHGQ